MNLTLDIAFPPWVSDARCVGEDPGLFYPHTGESASAGKAICGCCPVALECLAYALAFEAEHPGSRWGIFGGTTPEQRRDRTPKRCTVPVYRGRGRHGACRKVIEADGLCRDHLTDAARARLAEAHGRYGGSS